jgi:hypothetical protein
MLRSRLVSRQQSNISPSSLEKLEIVSVCLCIAWLRIDSPLSAMVLLYGRCSDIALRQRLEALY